jgi:Transposase DNA-binding
MEGSASFGDLHFGAADLGDARRVERLIRVADQLALHPHDTFPKKFHDPAELKAFYRLMKQEAVTHESVLTPHRVETQRRMEAHSGVVLILHDTTVLDYSGLKEIEGLGQVGDGHGRGYYAHNSLAVAAETRWVLGLASQILHTRRRAPPGEKKEERRRRADRESRLWKKASQLIPPAPAGRWWVDVADRGADITEFLDYEEQAGKKYVVRSQHNRRLVRENQGKSEPVKLHDWARTLAAHGERTVEVKARPGQQARLATVGVAWQAVTLRPPRQRRGDERGVPLPIWMVRVWESAPPPGVEGLEWILLTNVPVNDLQQACERVDWYSMRWIIEEYHKGMKTGCDIEAMQFSYRERLEPAIALVSVVALTLLQLRDQSRDPQAARRRADEVLPLPWIRLLSRWRHGEAREDWTLHEFYFALARLGGHQNRKHDHPPGWLVLWRGWTDLQLMLAGAAAAKGD